MRASQIFRWHFKVTLPIFFTSPSQILTPRSLSPLSTVTSLGPLSAYKSLYHEARTVNVAPWGSHWKSVQSQSTECVSAAKSPYIQETRLHHHQFSSKARDTKHHVITHTSRNICVISRPANCLKNNTRCRSSFILLNVWWKRNLNLKMSSGNLGKHDFQPFKRTIKKAAVLNEFL